MTLTTLTKTAAAGAALAAVVLTGTLISSSNSQAQDGSDDASRVQQGFAISPVRLNLSGKNSTQVALVGLGSYIVNASGDCNGCHTSGGPPNYNYLSGHNPYFLFQEPTQTDPSAYLAGGTDFGPAVLPSAVIGGYPPGSQPPSYPPAAYGTYAGPDIISRNLTPNKYGQPEGGHTLSQFMQILRTGIDFDNIHPTCAASSPTPTPANCIPPPVDGSRLQVMPWPGFHSLSDHDMEAVYEFLSAIPCIDNKTSMPPAGAPNELRNNCGN